MTKTRLVFAKLIFTVTAGLWFATPSAMARQVAAPPGDATSTILIDHDFNTRISKKWVCRWDFSLGDVKSSPVGNSTAVDKLADACFNNTGKDGTRFPDVLITVYPEGSYLPSPPYSVCTISVGTFPDPTLINIMPYSPDKCTFDHICGMCKEEFVVK